MLWKTGALLLTGEIKNSKMLILIIVLLTNIMFGYAGLFVEK